MKWDPSSILDLIAANFVFIRCVTFSTIIFKTWKWNLKSFNGWIFSIRPPFSIWERYTQILIFSKIIYFSEAIMRNFFSLFCSTMLQNGVRAYWVSKLFPDITLTNYDNKKLSFWLTKVNLLNMYISLTAHWKCSFYV